MIDDRIKIELINLIEENVVSILIASNYVTHLGGGLNWKNIVVKDETLELIKILDSKESIDADKLITELMDIFPKEQLDSRKALTERWHQFLKKCTIGDITHSEIIEAAEYHVNEMGPRYCGNLFYFFYKEDKKIYQSRLEKTILLLRDKEKFTKTITTSTNVDWNNTQVI
jgi:hypothetical protein